MVSRSAAARRQIEALGQGGGYVSSYEKAGRAEVGRLWHPIPLYGNHPEARRDLPVLPGEEPRSRVLRPEKNAFPADPLQQTGSLMEVVYPDRRCDFLAPTLNAEV